MGFETEHASSFVGRHRFLTRQVQPNERPLRSKRSHRRPASSPPPPAGQQLPRAIAPSQAHPVSAFDPPNQPFRESGYYQVSAANGHPVMQFQTRCLPYANNAYAPVPINREPQILPRAPQPPPSAFEDFLVNWVQARPNEYQVRDEEDLYRVGQAAWEDASKAEHRRVFEERYDQNYQRYVDQVNDLHQHGGYESQRYESRSGREQSSELPPPPPPPPPPPAAAANVGGAGGFTSING